MSIARLQANAQAKPTHVHARILGSLLECMAQGIDSNSALLSHVAHMAELQPAAGVTISPSTEPDNEQVKLRRPNTLLFCSFQRLFIAGGENRRRSFTVFPNFLFENGIRYMRGRRWPLFFRRWLQAYTHPRGMSIAVPGPHRRYSRSPYDLIHR